MAIKFQYNKTALQELNKQLKVRQRALPTLQNKEAALRVEVKKAKKVAEEYNNKFNQKLTDYDAMVGLWNEFDSSLITLKDVSFTIKKIAGIKTPILNEVFFDIKEISLFDSPSWIYEGLSILKELVKISIEREFFIRKMELLDYARKKTTQKVNLYEKVQIPGYEDAIRKIKRFMEDEENLSKSAQKIVKKRQEMEVEK